MHSSLVHGLSFCKVQIILILSIFHINFQRYDSFSVIHQLVIYIRHISFHRKKIIGCTHVDVCSGLSGRRRSDKGEVNNYTTSFSNTHAYRLHIDHCLFGRNLWFLFFKGDKCGSHKFKTQTHIQFL